MVVILRVALNYWITDCSTDGFLSFHLKKKDTTLRKTVITLLNRFVLNHSGDVITVKNCTEADGAVYLSVNPQYKFTFI